MQITYSFQTAGRPRKSAPAPHPFRLLAGLLAALCLLASPGFAQDVLWGLTSAYGPGGAGTAFSLRGDGSEFAVRKAFVLPPSGPNTLVPGPDGNYYGTTTGGGSSGLGAYFRIGADGTGFTVLKLFTDSDSGVRALVPGPDGYFYGFAGGSSGTGAFVKMLPDGTGLTVLFEFSGTALYPTGLVRGTDGVFYGTTAQGGDRSGTIFRINADGTGFAVLKALSFEDGTNLSTPLAQGTDGFLYGTAPVGGANGEYGSIFRIRPDGSGFAVIKSFAGGVDGASPRGGVVQGPDGSFYGTTMAGGGSDRAGTVFKINGDGSGFVVLRNLTNAEGAQPYGNLLLASDGSFYGTTYAGGSTGNGTIFKIAPDGSGFAVLKNFAGTDGSQPRAGLVQRSDGTLYGTTAQGGSGGYGTIFKLNPDGSNFTPLTSFESADGATGYAYGTLVQAGDGNFYGTTEQSERNAGTVFRLRPDGTYTVLKVFDGTDGSYPRGTLLLGGDGSLYGTTQLGAGGQESGTVFKINPDGSGFTVLKTFSVAEGIFPGPLLAASDGYFYGTTANGGIEERGSFYRIRADGTGFAVLKLFTATERVGSAVAGPGGVVYGTMTSGGNNNLIRVNANGSLTIIKQFTTADNPGGLVLNSGNTFYCIKGTDDFNGAICRINADGTGFASLKTFTGTDGSGPTGLVQGNDGTLYGMTQYGGTLGNGTIFRLNPDGSNFAVLRNLSGADGVYPAGKLIIEGALSISSFTPAAGPVGTSISLFGQHLAGATGVKIGGTAATFTVVSNTQLSITVPQGTTGGPIEVTTPAGTVTSQGVFTVTASPAPVIANFTPKRGSAGTKVTITGTHFDNATAVHFNNVPAAFTNVSSTVITATVPAGNASGFVTVTTPGGKATSRTKFTVITAVWQAAGTQSGDQALSVVYFPNPFRSSFTVRLRGKGTGKLPFRIYNPDGQVVLEGDDLQATQRVTLGNRMARGIYYLEVGSGEDVKRYRLVKTN